MNERRNSEDEKSLYPTLSHPSPREKGIKLPHFNSFSNAVFPFPNVFPQSLVTLEIPRFWSHLTINFLPDSGLMPLLSLTVLLRKRCIKIILSTR